MLPGSIDPSRAMVNRSSVVPRSGWFRFQRDSIIASICETYSGQQKSDRSVSPPLSPPPCARPTPWPLALVSARVLPCVTCGPVTGARDGACGAAACGFAVEAGGVGRRGVGVGAGGGGRCGGVRVVGAAVGAAGAGGVGRAGAGQVGRASCRGGAARPAG